MTSNRRYLLGLDGLRAVAIASVFVYHLNSRWLPGGYTGVDVFFVISGFLIIGILLREFDAGAFSFARFYQRPIARLLAPFVCMLLLTMVAARVIYSEQDFASAGANLVASAASVTNLKALLQGNYFELSADAQPLLHTWSLSVEEQFYLLFPVGLWLLHRYVPEHRRGVLIMLAVASFVACVVVTRWRVPVAFYLLPTRAWELMIGGLVATIRPPAARIAQVLSLAGIVLVGGAAVLLADTSHFPGAIAALPALGAAAVILGCHRAGPVTTILSVPAIGMVGRLSYSLYLWHWPTFALVDYALL